MNYEININESHQIISATVTGVWKLEHSDKLANEMIAVSKLNGYTNVLIDHRDIMINIPYFVAFKRPSQLKVLFDEIKPRIAFIPPYGRNKLYHFFETVARNRGINFRIFKDQDTAYNWLKTNDLD